MEGSAIFIKNSFFDSFSAEQMRQEKEAFHRGNYQKCHVPAANASYYVDELPDSIKSILRQGLNWEGNEAILMEKFTREGTLAIDIGAHIGVHTICLSRKVGPRGAVIAFEPQKKMYRELLENLELNQCSNVISLCKALGQTSKAIHLTPVDLANEGGTGVGEGGEPAQMVPLDSLNLQNVSFIKIDVENYELFVLRGAKETILRNNPVIMFELNGSHLNEDPVWQKENADQIFSLLASLGYEMHCIFNKDWIAFPPGSKTQILRFKQVLSKMLDPL
ncbi:MAG TPA: FkbM family methyltransferase [Chlamydiales bacterium]|nr:FkbM family methyltransferase [Chlamydiales bacterium]